MTKLKPKVIAIVGPTASGKTGFAISLAKKLNGEIISADSRLVYKGFDIGTAKPSIEEREGIPHYMIDIVEPEFDYSAGLYAQEAEKLIFDISKRGKVPVVVGGTGLYFRLLLENYDVPKVEPDYELREKLSKLSYSELVLMLEAKDPARAKEIEVNDNKKLIRAIEMAEHLDLSALKDDLREYLEKRSALPGAVKFQLYNIDTYGNFLPANGDTPIYVSIFHI